MKHLDVASSAMIMFGAVLTGLLIWVGFRPEIQSALRAAQEVLFRLQP